MRTHARSTDLHQCFDVIIRKNQPCQLFSFACQHHLPVFTAGISLPHDPIPLYLFSLRPTYFHLHKNALSRTPGGGPGGAGNGIDFPDNVEHPHLYPTVRTLSLSSLCERLPASCVEPSTCACRRAHVCGVRFSVPGSGHASATPCLVFLNPKSGSGPVSAPPFLIFLDAFSRGRRAHSLACSVSCVFVRVCVYVQLLSLDILAQHHRT